MNNKKPLAPTQFFSHLKWIDGRTSLLDTMEPYRQRTMDAALYTFDDNSQPLYNLVLLGRAKKNWKSSDLILATLYKLLVWVSPNGNDCFVVANDEDQAADDLDLLKKLVAANPVINREVSVQKKAIARKDGKGTLRILPAQDTLGMHGKTYLFLGIDEMHGYKNYDVLEGLAPDPTRNDAVQFIVSYDSFLNSPGYPLFDYKHRGIKGDDPRMYFSWYSADYCTDPTMEGKTSEEKANPSMSSWNNPNYLEQQKRRLPTHKYRRLHLNLPGMPEGAFYDAEKVMECVVTKRSRLQPQENRDYQAFVDMSGGSSDDACFSIAHYDKATKRTVLVLLSKQTGNPPFNPRHAVAKFAGICQRYGIRNVTGDRYAGETFRQDFADHGIHYTPCKVAKSVLYEELEPLINAAEVELLDDSKLFEQLLGLTVRGTKIDHLPGEHDDYANAAAGAVWLAAQQDETVTNFILPVGEFTRGANQPPHVANDFEDRSTTWNKQ